MVPLRRRWKGIVRSLGRKAVPIADVGASIAEAVPIFGASVKGALEASIKVQRILEVRVATLD